MTMDGHSFSLLVSIPSLFSVQCDCRGKDRPSFSPSILSTTSEGSWLWWKEGKIGHWEGKGSLFGTCLDWMHWSVYFLFFFFPFHGALNMVNAWLKVWQPIVWRRISTSLLVLGEDSNWEWELDRTSYSNPREDMVITEDYLFPFLFFHHSPWYTVLVPYRPPNRSLSLFYSLLRCLLSHGKK